MNALTVDCPRCGSPATQPCVFRTHARVIEKMVPHHQRSVAANSTPRRRVAGMPFGEADLSITSPAAQPDADVPRDGAVVVPTMPAQQHAAGSASPPS